MTALREEPLVYSIPSGAGFADALAAGLLAETQQKPEQLSDYLILLPSRRACRTLRDAFLRLSGGRAILLPRLMPIGEADADELSFMLAGDDESVDVLNLPPAVGVLERQFILARTIMAAGRAQSFDQAVMLAQTLARFLDESQAEEIPFSALNNLVPDQFSAHWGETLTFLSILTEQWPQILAERGLSDVATRRQKLLDAQCHLWHLHPPQHPVVAAGVTGLFPAHRRLLHLIARLPQGRVIVPGLDMALEQTAWDILPEDHPQHALKKLLHGMEVVREQVKTWPVAGVTTAQQYRVRLLSEALRPAESTERWRRLTTEDLPSLALQGISRIDVATAQEEAETIALLMREVLETAGKTAALVTPDRRLARRVALALSRWGIEIDDTGGQPLTETLAGRFFLLLSEAAAQQLAPVALLAFLKHPFLQMDKAACLMDRYLLRGPRPDAGFEGLFAALARLEKIPSSVRKEIQEALEVLQKSLAPFLSILHAGNAAFADVLRAQLQAAEILVPNSELWRGTAGEAAADFFSDMLAAAENVPPVEARDYNAMLRLLMKNITVRPGYGAHPRLSILGQIEARLHSADMVILSGLNEGVWPAIPEADPWMSRQMRQRFGLPMPEKMLGIAAHDFIQAAAGAEVVLTRALRVDGAPTVPARWLLRLDAVLTALGYQWPQNDAVRLKFWRQDMDRPAQVTPVARPAPCPPLHLRPRRLSVTKIERWMRDPYVIYARHVLKLEALDPIDADPGGAERGNFIHKALEKFVRAFPVQIPDDALPQLLDFGRQALQEERIPREVEAFWWPRFEKIAVEFLQQDKEWRQEAKPFAQEISGTWSFAAPGGLFELTGKADRIDRLDTGGFAIIDYKSGQVPSKGDVENGFSPQLPLEALMLSQGGFANIKGETGALVYWKVTGSGQNPVERKSVIDGAEDVSAAVKAATLGLQQLVEKFDDPATPYISQPRAKKVLGYSDYDHLSRVKEWGQSGEGDAE